MRKVTVLAAGILLIAALVTGLVSGCDDQQTTGTSPTGTAPGNLAPPPNIPSAGGFSAAIIQATQAVKPAVVRITNQQQVSGQFNQPYTIPAGVGSGVIYDDQGHILTNNHVIEGAQSLLVTLPDGRSFSGKIIGGDSLSDIAVVQITGDNLPVASLGDSSKGQVGEWVVAIGNALALPGGPTVTAGVISALGRAVQEPATTPNQPGPYLFDVIQTDAPINPGNSGGPLVTLSGQVIGINTLVASSDTSGAVAQGIGFAISVNTAKSLADQIVATGHVVHPYMGITYAPLDPAVAAHLGLNITKGVLVSQVASGSPAAAAGLKPNDVITSANGTPLVSDSDLAGIINTLKPGDKVNLTVQRGGNQMNIQVILGTAPSTGG